MRSKIRAIPSHQNQENFRTSVTQRRAKGFLSAVRSTLPPQGPGFLSCVQNWCEALFLPSLLSGSWHEIRGDVRSGWRVPWRSCVFLHDLATYTWRSSFRHAGYLGDLMLLHDLATSTWSCSFRLLGAVEIFPAFCSGRRIAGGRARLP